MSFELTLTPVLLLRAYANGIFPMATSRDGGEIQWFAPDPRAIIEFERFTPGRRFRRLLRRHPFEIRINTAFRRLMELCAAPRPRERDSWISAELIDAYSDLHEMGFAHSVEAWLAGKLVGGLYVVQLGAAMMGESMVSRVPDASKVCLLTLMQRMRERGFTLLDTQFLTPHLQRFGGVEISRAEYERRLADALATEPTQAFDTPPTVLLPPGEAPAGDPAAVEPMADSPSNASTSTE